MRWRPSCGQGLDGGRSRDIEDGAEVVFATLRGSGVDISVSSFVDEDTSMMGVGLHLRIKES